MCGHSSYKSLTSECNLVSDRHSPFCVCVGGLICLENEVSVDGALVCIFIGYQKFVGYLFVVVVCWCWLSSSLGMILSFSFRLLFLLLTPLVCLLCLWKAARELRKERKRRGYLWTRNFMMGFTIILWRGTLSRTSRSSHFSQTRRWNILVIFAGKSFVFVVCPVGVFSKVFLAETVVNRIHILPLSPGLSSHVCFLANRPTERESVQY